MGNPAWIRIVSIGWMLHMSMAWLGNAFCVIDLMWGESIALQWRHNGRDGVSDHQPHDCLLNSLPKKTSKLSVTGLCEGNSPVTSESPHKGPVTGKMFPFNDVIMGLLFEIFLKYRPYSVDSGKYETLGWVFRYMTVGAQSNTDLAFLWIKNIYFWSAIQ